MVQFTSILTSTSADIRSPSTDFSRPLIKTFVIEKYQNGGNRIIWVSISNLKNKRQSSSHMLEMISSKGKVSQKFLKLQIEHPQNAAEEKFLLKSRTMQWDGVVV